MHVSKLGWSITHAIRSAGVTLNPVDALVSSVRRVENAASVVYDIGGTIVDSSVKTFTDTAPGVAVDTAANTPGIRNKVNDFIPQPATPASTVPNNFVNVPTVGIEGGAAPVPSLMPIALIGAGLLGIFIFKHKKKRGRK